jgi:hypothetical protein
MSRKGRRWEGRKRKAGRCLWNGVSSMRREPLSALLIQSKYPSMPRYISPCLNRPLLVGTLYTQDAHENRNLCLSTLHVVFAQGRWRLPGSYQVAYGNKILPPIQFIGDAFMLEIKSVDVAFQNIKQYGRVTEGYEYVEVPWSSILRSIAWDIKWLVSSMSIVWT